MEPCSPYRDPRLVDGLRRALAQAMEGLPPTRVMHVCGTHEHEIGRYALRQLLPKNLEIIAGPGCPVCITPASAIVTAARIACMDGRHILCAYGDVLNVPTGQGSLSDARRDGGDVRLVYGPPDAVRLARENPDRRVVFFSVGFETTAAPVAALLRQGVPDNFCIYTCHRYVPTAVEAIAALNKGGLAGFLLPGHAAVISGLTPYRFLPDKFGSAAAAAGFEPVDILLGLVYIARQLRAGKPDVQNAYARVLTEAGNTRAQEALGQVFRLVDAAWRGIGVLPGTGFQLKDGYASLDALTRLGIDEEPAEDIMPGCSCHLIMLGRKQPADCPLFGRACTPAAPKGPCMVGTEGTCRAWFVHGDPTRGVAT